MDVRLIIDQPAEGAWNMALDEALLELAERGERCLRFYGWSPATLSLGYFQRHRDRQQHAASAGLPLVRRATGGGAIVHHHELTYSFTTPTGRPFSRRPAELVRLFHQTLCAALADWRLPARLADAPPRSDRQADAFLCFHRRCADDVLLGRAKIAGSAQRRRRHALLQHGSLLLRASPWAADLPGILEQLAAPIETAALIDAWSEKLARAMGANLRAAPVSEEERRRAAAIRRDRFAAAAWTFRR